jgi:hypothetical protein
MGQNTSICYGHASWHAAVETSLSRFSGVENAIFGAVGIIGAKMKLARELSGQLCFVAV